MRYIYVPNVDEKMPTVWENYIQERFVRNFEVLVWVDMGLGIGREKGKLVQINQESIKGQKGTGYEGPEKGEFSCRNCEYFKPENSSCGQKDMLEKSSNPKTSDGRREVKPLACCEYVERIGKYAAKE